MPPTPPSEPTGPIVAAPPFVTWRSREQVLAAAGVDPVRLVRRSRRVIEAALGATRQEGGRRVVDHRTRLLAVPLALELAGVERERGEGSDGPGVVAVHIWLGAGGASGAGAPGGALPDADCLRIHLGRDAG
ncbi:MAG TPA: hypothetical protein VNK50_13035 [Calidithermus sp.]|nr:hypothetical protein [Calidithermus sp.]